MSDDTPQPTKRRSLGRGLDALFGDDVPEAAADGSELSGQQQDMRRVPIAWLEPNPYQPRRHFDPNELADLASSVQAQGVIQPLLVRPTPGQSDRYQIIAGERRWRAAQQAQLHDVPVYVRPLTDNDALHLAIVENVQRADLSAIEEAEGYRRLVDEFGHTQQQLSDLIGKSRSHIANLLRLLDLPGEIQAMVLNGDLSPGHARALIGANDPHHLADIVLRDGLSVRQTEALVKATTNRTPEDQARRGGRRPNRPNSDTTHHTAAPKDADTLALEEQLSDRLGMAVTITPRGSGGNLMVQYQSLEQLDFLLQTISGHDD